MESNVTYNSRYVVSPVRLSWVAYVGLVVKVGLGIGLGYLLMPFNFVIGMLLISLCTVLGLYHVLQKMTVVIFADDNGVWCSRGLLPWQKGVTGVKWRDVNEGLTSVGLLPYITGAYRVVVTNRYTQTIEIAVNHTNGGHQFVAAVNSFLYKLDKKGV